MPGGYAHARRRAAPPLGPIFWWTVAGFVFAVLLFAFYVGLLALNAQAELQTSATRLQSLQHALASGDPENALARATSAAADVSTTTHRAQGDTHNPDWRVAELVPFLGPSLTAVRETSDVMVDASDNAVTPVATLAGTVTLSQFTPHNGRVDTSMLSSAAPQLSSAATALARASGRADAIDTSGTIAPVSKAVGTLRTQLRQASGYADAAQRAARLLPAMLGADGTRNYLVLFQNNAELRSTGGIPGALAEVTANHGVLTMGRQTSAAHFPGKADATSLLPKSTVALWGEIPGQYMQDVTLPPQFDLSGRLAQSLWRQTTGQQVDGVISVDPVALSYLLKATGPVKLPTGETLTSANAVKVLLSDSYVKYSPAGQDAFFARAASTVFRVAMSGKAAPSAMLKALAKAGSENRILVWSSHADEESQLSETTLAGGLQVSGSKDPRFGVYLNDATGSKMDYYLRAKVGLGRAECRADGKASLEVSVTLTNAAPKDAARSLPAYVTGGGVYGVKPGDISTQIAVYGPQNAAWLGTSMGGTSVPAKAAIDGGRSVSRYTMLLAPGESKTVTFDFLADAQTPQSNASAPGEDRGGRLSPGTVRAPGRVLDLLTQRAVRGAKGTKSGEISAFFTPMTTPVATTGVSVDCTNALH